MIQAFNTPEFQLTVYLLQAIVAVLAADLAVGITHHAMDSYGSDSCKVRFLATIFRNNRLHHAYPKAILRHGWINNVVETGVIGAGVLAAFWALDMLTWPILVFSFVVAMSGVVHRWQHIDEDQLCGPVRALQWLGLIQNRKQHMAHHREHNINYGIVTNVVNNVLEYTKFFRRIELLVKWISGRVPFNLDDISRLTRKLGGPAFKH